MQASDAWCVLAGYAWCVIMCQKLLLIVLHTLKSKGESLNLKMCLASCKHHQDARQPMAAAQLQDASAAWQCACPLRLCSFDIKGSAQVLCQVQRTLPQLEATCRRAEL